MVAEDGDSEGGTDAMEAAWRHTAYGDDDEDDSDVVVLHNGSGSGGKRS